MAAHGSQDSFHDHLDGKSLPFDSVLLEEKVFRMREWSLFQRPLILSLLWSYGEFLSFRRDETMRCLPGRPTGVCQWVGCNNNEQSSATSCGTGNIRRNQKNFTSQYIKKRLSDAGNFQLTANRAVRFTTLASVLTLLRPTRTPEPLPPSLRWTGWWAG